MAPNDSQAAQPDAIPPQFYPVHYHLEFGYLAPTLPFRRRVALIAKGVVLGAVVGAIVAIAVSPDREVKVRSLVNQAQAIAGEGFDAAPVRYAAHTLALPAAVRPPATTAAVVAPVPPAVDSVAAPVQKPAPKRQKKVARQPRRERVAPAVEPEPRSAHAGPYRRGPAPQSEWDRRPFGFGW